MGRKYVMSCRLIIVFRDVTQPLIPTKLEKLNLSRKWLQRTSHTLLTSVGIIPDSLQHLENMLTFMQTVMYAGKDGEDYVETRIKMYEQQRVKSSLTLLPDRNSSQQHLKRSNLQAYIWKQCLQQDIYYPTPKKHGWQQTDEGLVPVWFTCSQFPPSLGRKPPKKSKCGEEADDESSESQGSKQKIQPAKKRQKRKTTLSSDDTTSDTSSSSSESDSDFVLSSDLDTSDRVFIQMTFN